MAQFYMSPDDMREKANNCREISYQLESQMEEVVKMIEYFSNNWKGEMELFEDIRQDTHTMFELSRKLRLISDKLQEVTEAYEAYNISE